ncbi:MAG: GAF and ANTAR domain-containing protein [Pseudonocardia sp.]|nr:GAF and ANTAR domain-containing protein [Pseudonocardia sp.]
MAEPGVVTRALLAIARDDPDTADLAVLAGRICRACVDGLGVDGAAISLLTASSARETLHATDPTADLLEDLQFSLGEGACIEAATTGRPVLVPDLAHAADAARWPMFAAAVAEHTDVRAVFALPLQWGTTNLGVLDMHRAAPGSLDGPRLRDAVAATGTATLMMLGLRTDPGDGRWLDGSVSGRAVIHQATGMIVAQLGVSMTDAFARLRAYAFTQERPLGDVAQDVVSRRLRFTDQDPG